MRFTALASVILLGTLGAGCVDQRRQAYPGAYCDEYGCGAPVAQVVQVPAYRGGPDYDAYPRYRGGGYRGGPYGASPPLVGYNPATCSEC